MTFRDPALLWLLAVTPLFLLFLVARERHRDRLARRLVAERLRGTSNGWRAWRPWLMTAATVACVVALAGPRRGFTTVPVEARESNRVIVIDVSNSMAARDVGTSRLEAAKAIARRIIEAQSGRVAVIAFETTAEVICPLTTDTDAASSLLDTLEPGQLESPGSDLGGAIDAAIRLVRSDPAQQADFVVISDGEDQGTRLSSAVNDARARHFVISTVLVGSASGSRIPQPDGAELHDESGQVVTTYARGDLLEGIARSTGGTFFANPFSEHALDTLALSRGAAVKKKMAQVPIDRFQWPLAVGMVIWMCGSLAHRGAE